MYDNSLSLKHAISVIVIVLLIFCFPLVIQSAYAAEEVASGECGQNATFILDDEGVLTISGQGSTYNASWAGDPWKEIEAIHPINKVIIKKGITSIGDYSFRTCDSLTSVSIPNSVTRIGDGTFEYCSELTEINIPNSVNYIGDFTFRECIRLKNISLPDSVTKVGRSQFDGCISLESIRIPSRVTCIENYAFDGCIHLKSVSISNGVKDINRCAFQDCSDLTNINIPSSVTFIGDTAFKKCTSLKSISFPDSVTIIGESALRDCTSLESIRLSNSLESISKSVFQNCRSLKSISIPSSVTSIGDYAFKKSTSLTSVSIPNSVTSLGYDTFDGCSSLMNISIPDSVTILDDYVFCDCTSLKSIFIPDSVNKIKKYALQNINSSYIIYTYPNSYASLFFDSTHVRYVCRGEHTWDKGNVTKKATTAATGEIEYACTKCDMTKTEIIPKVTAPTGTVTILNTVANSSKKTNDVIWDKSKIKDATGYEINWKVPSATKWASAKVGNVTRGTTTGLSIGGLYQIRVRPYKAATATTEAAYGAWSPVVYRYFHTTQKIRLASRSKGSFTMSWAKNSAATGYQVLYTTNSNGSGAAQNVKTAGASATSITVKDIKVNGKVQKLKSGTTYYVQVREIRKSGSYTYIGNISCPVAVKVK